MAVNLEKLILYSEVPAFKNNVMVKGSRTISGNMALGANTKTWDITLPKAADLVDVIFKAPAHSSQTNRPSNAWFKDDTMNVGMNISSMGGPNNQPNPWFLSWRLTSPTNLRLTAQSVNPYSFTFPLVSASFDFRVVDYSAA
jgi:hypothetical protein